MVSLATITRETRLIGKFGVIGLVILMFLFFSFKGISFLIRVLNPPVVAPPEMKFGEISSNLPLQSTKPSYSYQVNTITGTLPNFPDRIRVYKTLIEEPDLLALQKARETARVRGYTSGETMVLPGEYRWRNSAGGILTYNINSKNFQFNSGIGLSKQDYTLGTSATITSQTLSYIQGFRSQVFGIDQQNPKISYFTSDGTNLIPTKDVSKAYLAQVDFNHINIKVDPFILKTDRSATIESLPVYYQNLDQTNHSILVKAGPRSLQFVRGLYANHPVDVTQHSTYPLKTSQEAFGDLQSGNAYILSTNNETVMNITEVSLGYFVPLTTPEYITPIYVFKGKDFVAYVDAIGTWKTNNQNSAN